MADLVCQESHDHDVAWVDTLVVGKKEPLTRIIREAILDRGGAIPAGLDDDQDILSGRRHRRSSTGRITKAEEPEATPAGEPKKPRRMRR